MATNLTDLIEVAHWWGSDISATTTGDIAVIGQGSAGQITKSQQRVVRRIMTNPGQYLFSKLYGGGVPQFIGKAFETAKVNAQVGGQMQLEPSVQQSPPPVVAITPIGQGLSVQASYTVGPEQVPAVLSFTTE